MKLGLDGNLTVESYLLVKDALLLSTGTPVRLVLTAGNQELSLEGSVAEISPFAEERLSPLGIRSSASK